MCSSRQALAHVTVIVGVTCIDVCKGLTSLLLHPLRFRQLWTHRQAAGQPTEQAHAERLWHIQGKGNRDTA